jgi:anti-sigma B factor antagonist
MAQRLPSRREPQSGDPGELPGDPGESKGGVGNAGPGAPDLAHVEVTERDGTMVVSISGEIDISNVDQIAAVISAQPNTGDGLVVELSEVGYLDSTAVSLLHDLALRLRQRAQRLAVVSPEDSSPRRVLELTALYRHAPLAEDIDSAIKLIRSSERL